VNDIAALLGDVPAAAAAKVASMLAPSADVEEGLRRVAATVTTAPVIDHVLGLARELGGKSSTSALDAYLSHPFRVARIALAIDPAPSGRTFMLGTLHNIYEISGTSESALAERGIPAEVTSAIRLLTIDRPRESDVAYLADFYGAIEAAGLGLIRTVDKLDNVLGLELLEEGPIKTSYIDLAEQFVGPIACRVSPTLGEYFADAIEHARRTPCDRDRLALYRERTGGA
jgi:hypothetical protein